MKVKQFVREIFAQVKRDWYMPVTDHQIYDTTERVIGTYMGKPLYRKTISGLTTPSVANTETNVYTVPDAEYIVSINGRTEVGVNTNMYHSPGAFMSTWASGAIIKMLAAGWLNSPIILTLEYTKTTDTATTSKVPFEPLTEYSTEERMIGYWIDGKPLYRKVVEFGALPNNTTSSKQHGISSINEITKISGRGYDGTNWSDIVRFTSNHYVGKSTITVQTNGDRSAQTALFIIEYTKTTD